MLEIRQLSKTYGKKVHACQDISVTIPAGSLTLLIGRNGAGKSTLIKCIMGLLRHEGEVLWQGKSTATPESKAVMGYIPEMPALYPNLTVLDHIEFMARAFNCENWKEDADKLLQALDLKEHKNKFSGELSKGMQQKLSICCALIHRPDFIIFDEPLIGLDPQAIRSVKNMMQELRAAGKTLLVSTHILDSMDGLWQQALILNEGKLINCIHAEQLKQSQDLEEYFIQVTTPTEENKTSAAEGI